MTAGFWPGLWGGVFGGIVGAWLMVFALVNAVRPYARRRVAKERATREAADANTWHVVRPTFNAHEGSTAHLSAVLDASVPVGIVCEFRARFVKELEAGTVRVSFEVGEKDHE